MKNIKNSAELRTTFLNYFKEKGHEIVPSSSLVPGNDPTLLFTNAGMVQFKEVFTGEEQRTYQRAASSQRCVRAGGKHNDLENVGYTARHHTFFEMLGNFSFGDYFKQEAIEYAWEFLTVILGIPAEKLWITVFEDDNDAADIWLHKIKVDPSRFSRIGAKDNFWSMGDTGPCGPCTEIFYDHGESVAGGPPGTPEEDGDRYIEIWNLVFMQYDRDKEGKLNPLPRPSVDTGMGLERLAAVMQGVHSNYEIDLFVNLINAVMKVTGNKDRENNSLRVIADHIRSCAFLIVDGVVPSNEGRGYVLRRIIRRAIRHGHKLGIRDPFFYKLVAPLEKEMGAAYPELTNAQSRVEQVLKQEEERFAETLDQGMHILELAISDMQSKTINGETIFKLYDTYGFPADLTGDIARERGLEMDMAGFEQAMQAQRKRARAASHFTADLGDNLKLEGETEFTGYDHLHDAAVVTGLFIDGKTVDEISRGQTGLLVLDKTPFYAESGGQVGDTGLLKGKNSSVNVVDTRKQGAKIFAHFVNVTEGTVRVGEELSAEVNNELRQQIALNHSATHLLHAALRQILGEHVTQKGSLVNAERLRFDFSHFEPVTESQLHEIENLVNSQIRANLEVETRLMSHDEAIKSGAMALFGEKYGDEVRVLSMGDFSVELCGGTHVKYTGDIGLCKIISESGTAAGVRRIEAVTGQNALDWIYSAEQQIIHLAALLKADRSTLDEKAEQLLQRNRNLEKELDSLKAKLASSQGDELLDQAVDVNGLKVLAARLEGADAKNLRETLDKLKDKLGEAAIVLAAVQGEKISLVAGVSKTQTSRLKAGDLVNVVAEKVGGRGGGRADMAQAGGNLPNELPAALAGVADWVRNKISA